MAGLSTPERKNRSIQIKVFHYQQKKAPLFPVMFQSSPMKLVSFFSTVKNEAIAKIEGYSCRRQHHQHKKNTWRKPHQTQEVFPHNNGLGRKNNEAVKQATKFFVHSRNLPTKDHKNLSTQKIVDLCNTKFDANIIARSVNSYVKYGLIGVSPLKRGTNWSFSAAVYNYLLGVYHTYLKLELMHSEMQSNTKNMQQHVNTCVNSLGISWSGII